MKLGLTNWVIGSVKQNNDDVLNVEKHYISLKNVMLLYTHNVLRDSINSDRFTEWLVKKNTSSCHCTFLKTFYWSMVNFLMLLIKKVS